MASVGLVSENPRSKRFRFPWLPNFQSQNVFYFDSLLKIRVQNGSCFLVCGKFELKTASKLFAAKQESTFWLQNGTLQNRRGVFWLQNRALLNRRLSFGFKIDPHKLERCFLAPILSLDKQESTFLEPF